MMREDRPPQSNDTDRLIHLAPAEVPYAGREAEPSEQLARARPGPRPAEPTPATTIAGAPAGATTPILADAGPETVELADPGNSWNASVAPEAKFGRDLRPDMAPRDPASPGVGPLPTYLAAAIAIVLLLAALYVFVQLLG